MARTDRHARASFSLLTLLLALSPGPAAAARPAGVPADWSAAIERQIADSEYEVTWQDRTALPDLESSWQAPNRAHDFRIYFTAGGIRVVPRSDTAATWEWSLRLARWGRAGSRNEELAPARLRVDGNRVECDRGTLVERYVNDRRGLEQAFTIGAAPATPGGLVHLDLALGGTLSPVVAEDGQAIDFATPQGAKVVHYAALRVEDAGGRVLRSRLEGFAEPGLRGVRIVYDDAGAAYPVTVDPLATSPAWTVDGDQADAYFGANVDTAGDVNGDGYSDVIIGAPQYDNGQVDEGRAFIYHGSAAGLSTAPAWTAEGNQVGAFFGAPVATAGDVNGDGYADVIIAATSYHDGETNEGRAFVYHGSIAGLQTSPAWTAESNQAGAFFGAAVATAGDVNADGYADIVIGASFYDNGQADEGAAFAYHGSAAGLQTRPAWTAESNQATSLFGHRAATAGDVNGDGFADVIVGAHSYKNGQTGEGRAFVYHGSVGGLSSNPNWTAESNQAAAAFGYAVGTAGDVNGDGYADVVVGASFYDNGQMDQGRAFVYHGSATGLQASPAWTAESDQAGASFGRPAATAGDVNGDGYADVIVAATGYDIVDLSGDDDGRVYVYQGSATGLSKGAAWTRFGDQAHASFGNSVATAGDVNGDGYADVLIGAGAYDNGQANEGRAYAYHGSAAGLAKSSGWTADGGQVGAALGYSVATAGDVNGDGYADVIVGAWLFDSGSVDEGRAFLYHGSAAGLSTSFAWAAEGDQAGANFGACVATAGDVNGDGYADVVVGAYGYDNGQPNEGRAFVYHGSPTGLAPGPAWTGESNQAGADFGYAVATAGDVNGDGYGDLIVGAFRYGNDLTEEGRAYAYHGSAAGLSTSAAWTAEGDQAAAFFGASVATAGDVNGDGYSDVIVGADRYDNGEADEGRAFIYDGSAVGLGPQPAWTAESDQEFADFGLSVATAGDVNGDGYSDVIVGAPSYGNDEPSEGRAFVYHGAAGGPSASPVWTAEGNQVGALFGAAVAAAGDVNGDGHAEVIVGAPLYGNGQGQEGRAFLYHGSAAGLSTSPDWTAESNQALALFGSSVSTAGDVNGDGYAEVIVGAPQYDTADANGGRAFVYYGNGGRGVSLNPRQRRNADGGPIAHLGMADGYDSFRLNLLGRTPFGRGAVRLEREVKALGTGFDGRGTEIGAYPADTGLSGFELSESSGGLLASTAYHWRVRLRYDPAGTPFAPHGRWLTVPWNGWQEAMLRTANAPAAARASGLWVDKAASNDITLTWDASCLGTDTDYAIYEGVVADFTSHDSRYCSTGGATTKTFAPPAQDTYYLVVPLNAVREGSYGTDSAGLERPPGLGVCLPQQIGACP